MTFDEACERLSSHANFPSSLRPEESLVYKLWDIDRSKVASDFKELREDIFRCLSEVNLHLNGEKPSSRRGPGPVSMIDRSLTCCIDQIIVSSLEYYVIWSRDRSFSDEFLNDVIETAWMVASQWADVLAGDVDSPRENTQLEGQIRGVLRP